MEHRYNILGQTKIKKEGNTKKRAGTMGATTLSVWILRVLLHHHLDCGIETADEIIEVVFAKLLCNIYF